MGKNANRRRSAVLLRRYLRALSSRSEGGPQSAIRSQQYEDIRSHNVYVPNRAARRHSHERTAPAR